MERNSPPRQNQIKPYQNPLRNNSFYGKLKRDALSPICVLKIELDGQNLEEIRVFKNDNAKVLVDNFS